NSLDFEARIYDTRLGRWLSPDPLVHQFSSWSPYNFAFNNSIKYVDPDGRAPFSTIIDKQGKVLGGSTQDGDLGVYQVEGLTEKNFDASKISEYKKTAKRVGETKSLYSFVLPGTDKWVGSVNFDREAKANLNKATRIFGDYLNTHSESEGFSYYKGNAGNGGILDIKSWNFEEKYGKKWEQSTADERIAHVYVASFVDDNVIMTRRDQGNFFAGRAMKMTNTSEDVMMAGFGAFQSNGNKTGFLFMVKAGFNYIERGILGAALAGTPAQSLTITPAFADAKVSQDLQLSGYRQYER
ncbi:MAG: hypothetical protein KF862_23815, partial [Chitinophagaceae bacterium]|nr:hypothetical protein [Chitinophagaceae bacterium]